MESRHSEIFQYIRIPGENKRLFCLQQSLSGLMWMLFFTKDSLTPIVRSGSNHSHVQVLFNRLRGALGLVKKNIYVLGLFAGYKWQWLKKDVVVELPQYGHLCVPIHKGHKVFDFDRNRVIKIFDRQANTSVIREEIDVLQVASRFEFAPSIKEWNVEEKWYAEEYLQGTLDSSYTPMNSATVKKKFSDELLQPLIHIMLSHKPMERQALNYVLDLARKPPMQAAPGTKFPHMVEFIDVKMNQIRTDGNGPIFLVYAHGDFVPANMLNTPQGMKIIDWEGAGYRSALFDFYTYFFYRPANRKISISAVREEIQEALPLLLSELSKKDQEISRNIQEMERGYRWTFYIELISRLLGRDLTDNNLDIPYYVQRYLRAFHEYEAIVDDKKDCVFPQL